MNMITATLLRTAGQPARTPSKTPAQPPETAPDSYTGAVLRPPGSRLVAPAVGLVAGAAIGATAEVVAAALGHSFGGPAAVIAGAAFIFSGSVAVNGRSLTDVLTPFKPAEGDSERVRTRKTIANYAFRLGGGAAVMAVGLFAPPVAAGALGLGIVGAIVGLVTRKASKA